MCLSVIKWPLIHGYIFFLAKNPSKKQNDSPKLLMFVKYTDTHYTLYAIQPCSSLKLSDARQPSQASMVVRACCIVRGGGGGGFLPKVRLTASHDSNIYIIVNHEDLGLLCQ